MQLMILFDIKRMESEHGKGTKINDCNKFGA